MSPVLLAIVMQMVQLVIESGSAEMLFDDCSVGNDTLDTVKANDMVIYMNWVCFRKPVLITDTTW